MGDMTSTEHLLERKSKVLSPTYYHHYEAPLHVTRGKGVKIWDVDGKEYLDCYNNVPSVGHCHPHILEAMQKQASLINTHSRYLHENVVAYAERLTATLPPELDMCVFACTGTEANGLAYEIARTVTGNCGAIVSEGSYHGNVLAVAEVSLYQRDPTNYPDFVRSIPLPDSYRGAFGIDEPDLGKKFAALANPNIDELARSKHGVAMLMIDTIFDAQGVFTTPSGYLADLFKSIRKAGGLVVADEVQSGLIRLGDNMWGFMDSDVVPDIVTMGKPMGAGHPLAVVAAKRVLLEEFVSKRRYFNTFGGTPVSTAIGTAVLDVVEGENLQQNVHDVGVYLKGELEHLGEKFDFVGDVRGKGLFLGIDLVKDRSRRQPNSLAANELANDMRHKGVLVSVTGIFDNVLKIRPPLVFSHANADHLLEVLQSSLQERGSEWTTE